MFGGGWPATTICWRFTQFQKILTTFLSFGLFEVIVKGASWIFVVATNTTNSIHLSECSGEVVTSLQTVVLKGKLVMKYVSWINCPFLRGIILCWCGWCILHASVPESDCYRKFVTDWKRDHHLWCQGGAKNLSRWSTWSTVFKCTARAAFGRWNNL